MYQISLTAPAYLRVELPDLSYAYTLGRRFKISDSGLLVSEENYPLYAHINLDAPYSNLLQIMQTGEVNELIADTWTLIGQITAVLFSNAGALEDLGNGYFAKTQGSGEPNPGNPGSPGPFSNIKALYQIIFDVQKFYPHAVMLVKPHDCNDVLALARAVSAAMKLNISVFPLPDPDLAEIDAQADILENLIAEVDNGNLMKKELRDEASVALYDLLQDEAVYVNFVGNGDRGILALSAYSISDPPNPRPIPEQVVIKRIEDSLQSNTAKIYIDHMSQTHLTFEVQETLTPDIIDSWKVVLSTSNSHELLISRRILGQKVWYRINASNANGTGQWSTAVSFTSQR